MKRTICITFFAVLTFACLSFAEGQIAVQPSNSKSVDDSINSELISIKDVPSQPGKISDDVRYELIMNAFTFPPEIAKPNAAILISNKSVIKHDAGLFLAKRNICHTCGYNYASWFWSKSGKLLAKQMVNEESDIFDYKPEETKKRWLYYIKQLETAPTHYIYNLKIPVSISPKDVREKLESDGVKLFFLSGESMSYPSVYIWHRTDTYVGQNANDEMWKNAAKANKKKSMAEFDELANKVESVATVITRYAINYISIGKAGNYTTHGGSITLKLEQGSDFEKIKKVLEQAGVESKDITVKEQKTYYAQIVDPSPNIENIKRKLKKYTFIEDISEYTVEFTSISDLRRESAKD